MGNEIVNIRGENIIEFPFDSEFKSKLPESESIRLILFKSSEVIA